MHHTKATPRGPLLSPRLRASASIFFALSLLAAQSPQWKNQAEYDAYSAAAKETDAKKKLALVDAWKQHFPDTAFQQQRLALYVDAYRLLNEIGRASCRERV